MALKEIPVVAAGEQLMFKSMELAELVLALDRVEQQKKEQNDEWTAQIKAYRKMIIKLAADMKAQG